MNPPELAERDRAGASPAPSCGSTREAISSPFQGETFERVVADQVGFLERKL